jgi:hypothetical protein
LEIAGSPYTIIGIAPPGFAGMTGAAQLWAEGRPPEACSRCSRRPRTNPIVARSTRSLRRCGKECGPRRGPRHRCDASLFDRSGPLARCRVLSPASFGSIRWLASLWCRRRRSLLLHCVRQHRHLLLALVRHGVERSLRDWRSARQAAVSYGSFSPRVRCRIRRRRRWLGRRGGRRALAAMAPRQRRPQHSPRQPDSPPAALRWTAPQSRSRCGCVSRTPAVSPGCSAARLRSPTRCAKRQRPRASSAERRMTAPEHWSPWRSPYQTSPSVPV